MFRAVVVGVHGRESGRDAIALARELASREGEFTLVHVDVAASKPSPDSGSVSQASHRRDALEWLVALRDEGRIHAELACPEAGSVRSGLHDVAASRHADLLVVGVSREDEVARELIGDRTREVLADAPCPVAVAPLGYAGRAGAITKVGVAYDESIESERALSLARKLAAERGAELSVFEAVSAPMYVHDPWNVEGEIDERVEQARERLTALGRVEPHAEFADDAAEAIHAYGASVDLLVVGAHDYTPIEHVLERSLSQRLADDASTPLLVLASTDPRPARAAE